MAVGTFTETDLLRMAASLEQASEHPLAAAIVEAARERATPVTAPARVESVTGKGVSGAVEGHQVLLGNAALLADAGVSRGALDAEADARRSEGETVLFIVVDGQAAGIIAVADPIKSSTGGDPTAPR